MKPLESRALKAIEILCRILQSFDEETSTVSHETIMEAKDWLSISIPERKRPAKEDRLCGATVKNERIIHD